MKRESKQTSTTLLVQNLEPYVSDDDVRRVFEKFGSLESVRIIVTNPNTTKPHVPYKFAAMVKFSSSTEAKNALQGADGVNDWVVRYDPDSRPLPFKLTNKHKNRLPPWLYTPRQLADFVEKNELVPPLTRPTIQATGLPENLNGLIAQRMAPARLQLNLGPGVTPSQSTFATYMLPPFPLPSTTAGVKPTPSTLAPSPSSGVTPSPSTFAKSKLPPYPLPSTTAVDLPHSSPLASHLLTFGTIGHILKQDAGLERTAPSVPASNTGANCPRCSRL